MTRVLVPVLATLLLVAGCLLRTAPPEPVQGLARPISYSEDVKPILDTRCAVCHSCYNSPCQLKLSSYEGVDRGGSKAAVYSSSRLATQPPTRLFLDAESTAQWRAKGFHSVTESTKLGVDNDSIMLYLLDAKRRDPIPRGEYRAEATDLSCSANQREVRTFLGRHPQRGMPFGFPALPQEEHNILSNWLVLGAQGPSFAEQAELVAPSAGAAAEIQKWERFLNRDDPKHAMTARYLYEHFFLAHIRFADVDGLEFYRLVRTKLPPGQPLVPIATVRPYDDPGVERVYYRFEKIHSTIVYKTHMVVDFDDHTLARYRELFIEPEWLEPPHRMGYGDKIGANPFLVYAQIPTRSRYQFLLDHSQYIVDTFIRGPVCKGQVALNVIHDHFWVMFLDPDADETVRHPEFLIEQAGNLRLPTESGSGKRVLKAFSDDYRNRYANFYNAKNALYDEMTPDGLGLEGIWPGDRPGDRPLLTIYRHFDSASVHNGALGGLPRTLWIIDYPQFERIYYALVAGFDVFGNVSHQVNVRRYMDYLRLEGELNFLMFMPPESRVGMLESWYIGEGALADTKSQEVLTTRGTQVSYTTDDPKRELLEQVVGGHLLPELGITFDHINYTGGREVPMPESFETLEDINNGFRALTAPGTGFIKHVTDTEVNVLYVRARNFQGGDLFFSIVINRWHDNVNSLFGEQKRLDPSKDTIDFLEGSIGAYPNYFLVIDANDGPELFDMLQNFDGSPEYEAKIDKFGVNRADEKFWETYDWFQQRFLEAEPIHAGLYDLNRYYPWTIERGTDEAAEASDDEL